MLNKRTLLTRIISHAANNFLGSLNLDWSLGVDRKVNMFLEQKDTITFIYIISQNGNFN